MPDSLVRLALELAFEVGRLGSRATPPIEPPRPLRPFLRFARLPDRALAAVRRALEDEEFLARVASVAGLPAAADQLDRPSLLFLTRPEGWAEELAGLAAASSAAAEEERAAREDRSAARAAQRAEAARHRAEEAADRARRELARVEPALAEERRLRRAAEQEVARATRELAEADERARAGAAELAELREELATTRRQADLERPLAGASSPAPVPADLGPAKAALDAARIAAGALHRALEELAAALGPSPHGPGPPPSAPPPDRPMAVPSRSAPSRRPLAIPPAVFDDSPEAAGHLVRVPGAMLLVDGYNAAMAIWPGLDVTEVRLRLIDALAELSARTGVRVHVVFDGADLGGAVPPLRTGPVRVSFSEPGTEADDVILAIVESLPSSLPVLVASSDRRVQDGARRLGANILSSRQLAAVVGR